MLAAAEKSSDPDEPLSLLIKLYALLGDGQKLEIAIERFETELKPDVMRIVEDLSRPYAYAMIGDKKRALDYAQRLVDEFGPWEIYYFVQDPIFDSLRGDPRYKAMARQYEQWLETVQ